MCWTGVIKPLISGRCSLIMLVPERVEHLDFALIRGVETLPATVAPADRCLWSQIEGCATAGNRRLQIAGIPEPDFPERRDTLEEVFGPCMGPGFPPRLPSGETLCARDRPSSATVTGMHERLQCTNYSLSPFSPTNSLWNIIRDQWARLLTSYPASQRMYVDMGNSFSNAVRGEKVGIAPGSPVHLHFNTLICLIRHKVIHYFKNYLTLCGSEIDVGWCIGAINSSQGRHCGWTHTYSLTAVCQTDHLRTKPIDIIPIMLQHTWLTYLWVNIHGDRRCDS